MGLRRKRGEMVIMEDFLYTDCQSLYSKLKHQHKQLTIKRRWLMGIALSDLEQKQVNRGGIFQEKKFLPESFLRDDDVHYETVKAFVKQGFETMNGGRECRIQDSLWTFNLPSDIRRFISLLDEMSNNGLQLVAELLTGTSLKFDKTRWKMKKIIKECLPEVLKNFEENKVRVERLYEIIHDPQNFRINTSEFSSCGPQKLYAAALKVLDGLEDLDSVALRAMHRKLRGIQGYIPQLQPKKSGWTRSAIIDQVRKMCMQMLADLDENDELQEPLAKAMSVAALYSKLIQGAPNVVNFQRFSSKIMAVQNEIAKAISLLDGNLKTVKFLELKKMQIFLDPNYELSRRSLRAAVKNLLMEFLFESSDLNTIPEFLFEVLLIVNRTSRSAPYRFFWEEEIEEEVENVLCVSAQMKQILWDSLSEHKYDLDFAEAYMEDLEDSDDGGNYDDDSSDDAQRFFPGNGYTSGSNEGCDRIEATGETSPVHFNDSCDRVEPRHMSETDLMDTSPFSTSSYFQIDRMDNMEENQLHKDDLMQSESSKPRIRTDRDDSSPQLIVVGGANKERVEKQEYTVNPEKPEDLFYSDVNDRLCTNRNHYLDVQEACDKTSLVTYQLIGCLLEEFAEIEGLDFDCADAAYLRRENLSCNAARAAKEHIFYDEAVHGSIVLQVIEELLPSFPESGKAKVKELMGLK